MVRTAAANTASAATSPQPLDIHCRRRASACRIGVCPATALPRTVRLMYTNTGKQVLKDGRHFADADSVENAELIAEGLNAYTGYSDQEPLLEPVERGEPVEAPPALQGTPRPC